MRRLALHAGDHVLGSSETATVQLVMYGDYECPYTQRGVALVADLIERADEALLYVFRNFPLVDEHAHALAAAQAAEAAEAQGRFWDMHLLIFRHQQTLDDARLRELAESIGLDVGRFDADRAAPATRARVLEDRASGERLGVDSTPTFFVNGEKYDGPVEGILALVEDAIAQTSSPGAEP